MGIRLLTDIRNIFGTRDSMRTSDLLKELVNMDESAWSDIRGKPMTDRGLAMRLRGYGVESKQVRIGAWTGKGYAKTDFADLDALPNVRYWGYS